MRKLTLIALLFGCGAPPQASIVVPITPGAPNSTSPASTPTRAIVISPPTVAVVARVASINAAPITAAPAPKHECTVFVMGDPKTAFKATVQDKQFKQEESTSTEINMYAKVLQGDDMTRIALCDAFAKRKCPEAWRGDALHCRMQMNTGVDAEWGSASPVPK